jgi:hypothetical protein
MPAEQPRTRIAESVSVLAYILLTEGGGEKFRALATEKSEAVAPADLPLLRSLLHDPPAQPSQYDPSVHGLGGWLSFCQFAIFELAYNLGEEALAFVREIAWGEYDLTQGNAIEVLIRFAAAGVRTEELIAEIETRFPKVRDEARLYAVKPLLGRLDTDPDLRRVFDRLLRVEAFRDSYDELTYVDPDPYNLGAEHLHAIVVSAQETDRRELAMHIIASVDAKDIASPDFRASGGVARICISDTCKLVGPAADGVAPVSLASLLRSKKIAIGHYSFKSPDEDGIERIYPRTVAVLA